MAEGPERASAALPRRTRAAASPTSHELMISAFAASAATEAAMPELVLTVDAGAISRSSATKTQKLEALIGDLRSRLGRRRHAQIEDVAVKGVFGAWPIAMVPLRGRRIARRRRQPPALTVNATVNVSSRPCRIWRQCAETHAGRGTSDARGRATPEGARIAVRDRGPIPPGAPATSSGSGPMRCAARRPVGRGSACRSCRRSWSARRHRTAATRPAADLQIDFPDRPTSDLSRTLWPRRPARWSSMSRTVLRTSIRCGPRQA